MDIKIVNIDRGFDLLLHLLKTSSLLSLSEIESLPKMNGPRGVVRSYRLRSAKSLRRAGMLAAIDLHAEYERSTPPAKT